MGASRGLGDALSSGFPRKGDIVWLVSRSEPRSLQRRDGVEREWIEADLSSNVSAEIIAKKIGQAPVDLFIYNAGIWEKNPFDKTSTDEIRSIVETNLTSLLLSVHHLLGNLRASARGRVILIGSTCGLENEGTPGVAYTATKFAMRGVTHSLRELLRADKIPVTCISPGSMATDVPFEEGAATALERYNGQRIPVQDVVALIRCIAELSVATCVKEIVLPALLDTDV
ncbi:MAG TPA: SDR family NAD(P)-dependent oxidoreductase [Elusimicrobiota bacterium]|nr:SDR family NAD(P)-dependent oxidoreductase [Elusimicrobiota bacterium]